MAGTAKKKRGIEADAWEQELEVDKPSIKEQEKAAAQGIASLYFPGEDWLMWIPWTLRRYGIPGLVIGILMWLFKTQASLWMVWGLAAIALIGFAIATSMKTYQTQRLGVSLTWGLVLFGSGVAIVHLLKMFGV